MKKIREKRIELFFCFLAFILSMPFFLMALKKCGIYPFGDKTLLNYDLYDQLLAFMTSVRYIGEGGNTLFFSGSRSMGGNYLGLYAYYVGGPLTYILNLFPLEKIPVGIEVLIILKLCLAGGAFGLLSVYVLKRKAGISDHRLFAALPLSIAYSLTTFNILYGTMFPMWLDGVIFLPLVILGIEKLFDDRKGLFYLVFLTILIYCNYYTGYMVGIFAALYFICRWISSFTKENVRIQAKRIAGFTFYSLMALGLTAPLLSAVFIDLKKGRMSENFQWDENAFLYDTAADFFHALFFNRTDLPTIYVGVAPIVMAVLFFFLPRIRIREKFCALFLNLFFWASFSLSNLYLLWHGLTYVKGFAYRFHFLYSFLILYIALNGLSGLLKAVEKDVPKKSVRAGILFFTGVFILMEGVAQGRNAEKILLSRNENYQMEYKSLTEYQDFINRTEPLTEYIRTSDNGFYRTNQLYEYSKNDSMILGYNGMTHYSSTYNKNINEITLRLGFAQGWIWNSGYGSTPLTDGLFGIRYMISDKKIADSYETLRAVANTVLYKNNLDAGMAFVAKVKDRTPDLDSDNPFVNQTRFVNAFSEVEETYFVPVEHRFNVEEGAAYVRFTSGTEDPVYLSMYRFGSYYAKIYVNDIYLSDYFTGETTCILYLGNFPAGENVTVKIEPGEGCELDLSDVYLVSCSMDKITHLMKELSENTKDALVPDKLKLSGKFYVPEGYSIMTSIPYDEGWRVYVDGKKVQPYEFADAFMLIPANAGMHDLTMTYIPPGITAGLLGVAAAFLALLIKRIVFGRVSC